jgi:hypothetical protein
VNSTVIKKYQGTIDEFMISEVTRREVGWPRRMMNERKRLENPVSTFSNQLAKQLRRIGARCRGGGRIADCRIIEALSS